MSYNSENRNDTDFFDDDEELNVLLKRALKDFKNSSNTDDEIDSLMAPLDMEAAEKAANNFENVLRNAVIHSDDNHKEVNGDCEKSDEISNRVSRACEDFQNFLDSWLKLEHDDRANQGQSVDDCNMKVLYDQMTKLAKDFPSNLDQGSESGFFYDLVKSFLSKEVVYEPMKELLVNFSSYLDEHNDLDEVVLGRYKKQIEIFKAICDEYEKEDPDDLNFTQNHFDKISSLLIELMKYGQPPHELLGETPVQFPSPVDSNLANLANSCNLI